MTDPLTTVLEYHQRTKHQFNRYAPSLGYTDWACQPDAFRRYKGAPLKRLPRPEHPCEQPRFDELQVSGAVPPQALDINSISRLFYNSLALSGWVTTNGKHWPLRCNPSAGGMHPTEVYLLSNALDELSTEPALFHYNAYEHGLEVRAKFNDSQWRQLRGTLPDNTLLLGLTNIHWRSAWKFGERAYRFCQHDLGHALGALSYAAAALGWQASLLSITDPELQRLLNIADQQGPEAEAPGCLLAISPTPVERSLLAFWRLDAALFEQIGKAMLNHKPLALSNRHHPWPVIDEVAAACSEAQLIERPIIISGHSERSPIRACSAETLFRQRRSAARMDGTHGIELEDFIRICRRLGPGKLPFGVLPDEPAIHLLFFVHRVNGLRPGVYAMPRSKDGMDLFREELKRITDWQHPAEIPARFPLYLIEVGDAQIQARVLSCNQTLASGGAFMACMLADFAGRLNKYGPGEYRRLHWEAGLLGQALYIEAEAAGLSGTGIGCFIDDAVHHHFGIGGNKLQVLYHFAVGGGIEDGSMERHGVYAHLEDNP